MNFAVMFSAVRVYTERGYAPVGTEELLLFWHRAGKINDATSTSGDHILLNVLENGSFFAEGWWYHKLGARAEALWDAWIIYLQRLCAVEDFLVRLACM